MKDYTETTISIVIVLCVSVTANESTIERNNSRPAISESVANVSRPRLADNTSKDKETFDFKAEDYVHSFMGDSLILRGNTSVLHRDAHLSAAEMVYYRKHRILIARALVDSVGDSSGVPTLKQGKDVIRGSQIVYQMDTGEGTIFDGQIHFKDGFYRGERIKTRGETEFHVHSGSYTTCDLSDPHFDFYSPNIKVLVGDMAIARPVYLRIKANRVAVVPFYVFSLRENRQSGLLTPSFGQRRTRFGSRESEWELRNLGYYLAPSEYWDLHLAADLRQHSGWLGRIGLAYARRYYFDGTANIRIEKRQATHGNIWQWWTDVRHNQQFGESASLRTNGTFHSSKNVVRNNSNRLNERLTRTLRSNLGFNKRWRESGYSLSINASRTENLDTKRFDTVFPEISLRRNRHSLFGSKKRGDVPSWYHRIYYNGSVRLRNTRRSTLSEKTNLTSSEMSLGLSTQQRPTEWISINSGLTQRWRDANLRSSQGPYKSIGNTRANFAFNLSQTLYGMFEPAASHVTAIRHVIKPDLGFNYQAARSDTGLSIGHAGHLFQWKKSRRLTMRLSNSFWLKLLHNEEESKLRIAQINISSSYDFDRVKRPLADLISSIAVNAGPFNTRFKLRSEFYDATDKLRGMPAIRQFEVNSSFRFYVSDFQNKANNSRNPQTLNPDGSSENARGAVRAPGMRVNEGYGYENGLNRDIDRSAQRQLQIGHYYSRSKNFGRILERSWLRTSATWSWRRSWHIHYSLNYNLNSDYHLLHQERVTAELLSIQREFHDWTATFNVEPTRFATNRNFYFKVQLKDIPQIRLERGDHRGQR